MENLAIKRLCQDLGIQTLVHFTHLENVGSILKWGLLPRSDLDRMGLQYVYNDPKRLDSDGLGPSCVSIGFPNFRMMHRYHLNAKTRGGGLCLIEIAAKVLWEFPCAYFEGNAAGIVKGIHFDEVKKRMCPEALANMFGGQANRFEGKNLPWDGQAEILVMEKIPKTAIGRIHVESGEQKKLLLTKLGFLKGVMVAPKVSTSEAYFEPLRKARDKDA